MEKVGGSGATVLLSCCSPRCADMLVVLVMVVNRNKAQNSVGIVVWKGFVKHMHTPRAHIRASLSQRQSRLYLLQPNHLSEVWIATKQLGIFCSYQAFNGFGETLQSCCHWLQNTPLPEKQCHWLLHEHPLPCMYVGVSSIYSPLVGKANSPGLTIFLSGLRSSRQYYELHMHMKGRPDTWVCILRMN